MTKTTRYGLIIAGLCTFFVVAPALVLYVQGKALNFKNRNTELTGIISVKTNPASANVTVKNEVSVKTPSAIRFLKTGDYDVIVSKTGYKTWHKTLNVIAGKVTYANPNPYPLQLLKDTQAVKLVSDVSAYASLGDKMLYATENMLVLLQPTDGSSITTKTPSIVSSLITDKHSNNVLLIGAQFTGILNTDNMQLLDFSKNTQGNSSTSLASGWIWSLSPSGILTGIQLSKPDKTFSFANDINSFLVQDGDVYYLSKNPDSTQALHHATISGAKLAQDQILATKIPRTEKSTILLDSSKAVYILLDSSLWRVNSHLELLAEKIKQATTSSGTLVYTKPGELWWYESSTNKSHLVTRATEDFSSFYVDPSLDYTFFTGNGKLIALELDDRSGQNRYELLSNPEPINNISVKNSTDIFFRLGKDLYSISVFDN